MIVLETAGWASLDDASREAFERLLAQLAESGVALARRDDTPAVARLEAAIVDAGRIAAGITGWENRWTYRGLADADPQGISHRAHGVLAKAEAMTADDYQALLAERAAAQAIFAAIAPIADAAITLSCPGPAPYWDPEAPDAGAVSRPTGDAIFNYPSSFLFAPAATAPMLAVDGMPVGVQVMGAPGQDAHVSGIARWLYEAIAPISV